MHADRQTILREARAEAWPIDPKTLTAILGKISTLADQIERVNRTELSPARTIILRSKKGVELSFHDAKHLRSALRSLPDVLRFYGDELDRKVSINRHCFQEEEQDLSSIVDLTRQNSLYERIRLADSRGQYHSKRLYRLVTASRKLQGFPPIKLRAFEKWLNELKKVNLATHHSSI